MSAPAPMVMGRWLPRQDFEGDDFTPGAGGKYVTCTDTAAGRMVAFATNGRIDKDGRVYRAAVPGHDPDGITLEQAGQAIATVAKLPFIMPNSWERKNVLTHLRYARGLIIQGDYRTIPRAYRYQANANFDHAMWASHLSAQSGNIRVWDPLNPDTTAYGRWIPQSIIWTFLASLGYRCGYVPLQSL